MVGLDLSIAATGAAYRSAGRDVAETWKLPAKLGDKRLHAIRLRVYDLTAKSVWLAAPDVSSLFVIEDLPTHAHGAGITGMVHGAVRAELIECLAPYALITPATLKKFATGKGNADKTAMAMAAYKRAGIEFADDNQCDAWWLRVAGLFHLGEPPFDLPAAQVDALDKVVWPALDGAR